MRSLALMLATLVLAGCGGKQKLALVGASYGGVAELVAAPALGSDVAGVASLSGELALPNSQLDALRTVPDLRPKLARTACSSSFCGA